MTERARNDSFRGTRAKDAMFQPRTAKIALFVAVVLTVGMLIGRFLP